MTTFDLSEACAFLKMEKSTLYNLMRTRSVPFIRRPHSRVAIFYREELESWLERGRVVSTTMNLKDPNRDDKDLPSKPDAGEVIDISMPTLYHRNPAYR